ncbi:MAG: heavy metal translocating P-type ATPase, partial [Pseudomonadota bacterium]
MSVAACPGCASGDPGFAERAVADVPTHHLVLPAIHCAGCISGVEKTLRAQPGIRAARVNLTQKRAAITAQPGADPSPWILALSRAGFEAFEAHEPAARKSDDLLLPLGVAGFAMMNVMLLSVAVWSGAVDTTRDFLHWVSAAIALPATAYAAQPFFRHAWGALKVGRVNMDVPISLAILLACGMSIYEVIHSGPHAWFDAALSLTFFLLVGRVLDQRLRRRARSAADDLAALEPHRAQRLVGRDKLSTPIEDIKVGDRLWIAAGDRIPVDAHLVSATAKMDRSFLTGESDPVLRQEGEALFAGEVALTGPMEIKATAVGEETTLRRIAQLIATSEGARGQYRSIADRAAELYTPMVHIVSFAAFLGWWLLSGDLRMAINVAIATLIITCPCALGLAVPAVAVAATSKLYREGLLLTSDTALERLAQVETVIFDKTGTLTTRALDVPHGLTRAEEGVLRSLAEASRHPICIALAARLGDGAPAASLSDLAEEAGDGVRARWEGQIVRLGRRAPEDPTTVFSIGSRDIILDAQEAPLARAKEAVAALSQMGLRTAMLTGDTEANAHAMARDLGIGSVWSEVQAEGKVEIVKALSAEGTKVLMVGDGLNDTAALAAADI